MPKRLRTCAVCSALTVVLFASWGCARQTAPRSVVLIAVDTLRADHLGVYGYDRPTSPRLDARARNGVVFEHVVSTSSWTLPAFASLYTGQFPGRHGAGTANRPRAALGLPEDRSKAEDGSQRRARAERFTPLAPSSSTLGEILSENGYSTAAIMSNPFLDKAFGVAQGFQNYDYARKRRANAIVDRALNWLEGRTEESFFLVVHFMDPHLPYDAPSPFRGRFTDGTDSRLGYPVRSVHRLRRQIPNFSPEDRAFIEAAYDEEIAYLDEQLGRLFDGLEELGLWQTSLVLFTSDHGEEFFEHGGFEHGHSLHEEVVRVPLIVWGPDVDAGRVNAPASIADIAPTILEATGSTHNAQHDGASLLGSLQGSSRLPGRGLVTEGTIWNKAGLRSVLLWPYKIIFRRNSPPELFDLEADPAELNNLMDSQDSSVATVVAEAEELLSAPVRQVDAVVVDPRLQDELRALGYVQ